MSTPPPTAPVAALARLAPLKKLAVAARAQWYYTAGVVLLTAAIIALEQWDDGEVKKAIRDWDDAANFLGSEQFGASLAAALPKDEDWTFDDRDAFDASMLKLTQEVDAIVKALEANRDILAQVAEKYRETIDGLVDALVPVLLGVIAAILLQAWPQTNPLAVAIGSAGVSVTAFILTEVWNNLSSLFSTSAAFLRSTSTAEFVTESRPGWSDPDKPDPNIRDIVINYNLDPSAYKKP